MLTTIIANDFAQHWIAAWNAHDLDQILSHYSEDVVFSSPFVNRIAGDASGVLHGRAALRPYFSAALERFPSLQFHLRNVLVGVDTLTILYDSINNLRAAETMSINDAGQVSRVWAQYDRPE